MAYMRKASEVCDIAIKAAEGYFGPTMYRGGSDDGGYRSNVGEWWNGCWHWDCLGFVHTVVNGFVGNRNLLGGGAVMDDFVNMSSEYTTLTKYCSKRGRFPVSGLLPGSLLEMHDVDGHVAFYVGDHGYYNTCECTGGGVRKSWTDLSTGNCYNSSSGGFRQTFENWGEFDRVDYDGAGPEPVPTGTVFTYQVWDDINRGWLPNVQNDSDYAGIFGSDIDNIYIDCSEGDVEYCVHTWEGDEYEHYPNGGQWLPWVKNREDFAGDNIPIDGIAIRSDKPCLYQVHLRKTGGWLETVCSENCNLEDHEYGFAGIIGQPIDAIIIRPF